MVIRQGLTWFCYVGALIVLGFVISACDGCMSYPDCKDDSQCVGYNDDSASAGFGLGMAYCVDGACRECRTAGDCDGACAECRNNACSVRGDGCDTDDACGEGEICQNCSCRIGCREDAECAGALVCCPDTNLCADCITDSQCPAGYSCEACGCVAEETACGDRRFETVYFDFDQSIVRSRDEGAIGHARDCLEEFPGDTLTIEGHCDERGTEAYNQALGERRARATRDFLVGLGVDRDRVDDTISYGELQPVARGHNESAWRQNRRAEFVWE